MTIQEFYKSINENYDEVIARLQIESFVKKYVLKFKDDDNYNFLHEAIKNADNEQAYKAAHTLKGLALNLGFEQLANYAQSICAYIKDDNINQVCELIPILEKEYQKIIEKIDGIS